VTSGQFLVSLDTTFTLELFRGGIPDLDDGVGPTEEYSPLWVSGIPDLGDGVGRHPGSAWSL